MINWMQKHRKYLVITIWISTIAFVGAGFVGWGAYSFASGGNVVAYVGSLEVTQEELNREYTNLYNLYNERLFGGQLDAEQAKALGLEEQALTQLISRTLMLNYAKDLGLRVSNEEVVAEVTKETAFWNNGVFDSQIYERTLQQANLRPKEYEARLRDAILLGKLDALLQLPLTDLEKNLLETVTFFKDKVSIEILTTEGISPKPTEEEVKKYWDSNKDIYLTDRAYKITYTTTDLDGIKPTETDLLMHYENFKNEFLNSDGTPLNFEEAKDKVLDSYKKSQAEKEALREYIQLRKTDSTNGVEMIFKESNKEFGEEFIATLSALKAGETLKPIFTPKGFISARLIEVIESEPKTFEAAKEFAREDLVKKITFETMENNAKKALETFNADKTKPEWKLGYISRANTPEIKGLDQGETMDFITQLFNAAESRGTILLQNKAILYEISAQRMQKADILTDNLDILFKNGLQLKGNLIEQEFLESLSKHYQVVRK